MSSKAAPRPKPTIAPWQIEFLERSSALTDLTGLAPSVAKLFLWLVVCEPPQQSTEQLRQTLGLSAAAVSTATSILTSRGLVERVTPTGDRRFSYRLHPRGWERLMRFRLEATTNLRTIFDTALESAPEPQPRLADLRAMYAWFETQITHLLAEHAGTTPMKI
jgi:DNA-binding transcriptional regulator GbsR (MarR family)